MGVCERRVKGAGIPEQGGLDATMMVGWLLPLVVPVGQMIAQSMRELSQDQNESRCLQRGSEQAYC